MNTKVSAIFTDHPASVGESYFEHMLFASRFSCKMAGAALAALVHAFLPFMFVSTASELVADMHNRNVRRFGSD
jgi:Family of unknown function (DUF6356)